MLVVGAGLDLEAVESYPIRELKVPYLRHLLRTYSLASTNITLLTYLLVQARCAVKESHVGIDSEGQNGSI